MKKKVFLIGAGPGDPTLLTVKAVETLKRCDAVLYDQLVSKEILKLCPKDAEFVFAGKYKNKHILTQDEINKKLLDLTLSHNIIGRLKGGDPFIFGRGGEEIEYLRNHGIETEVIPGISAAQGAAAALQIPLTHRELSSELVFLTGHKKKDLGYHDFSLLTLEKKTYIIYMGISIIEDIISKILSNKNNNPQTPIAVIENATKENQRIFTGTISNIMEKIKNNHLISPTLLIIGDTISFIQE
ncbi:MAG: uroporphyrinogen-III C-methyltransferase [Spirochaetia bacterium]|nr:uroporphyrinogen-III C-methyltransferase [Spirochaetia bacterium]